MLKLFKQEENNEIEKAELDIDKDMKNAGGYSHGVLINYNMKKDWSSFWIVVYIITVYFWNTYVW